MVIKKIFMQKLLPKQKDKIKYFSIYLSLCSMSISQFRNGRDADVEYQFSHQEG